MSRSIAVAVRRLLPYAVRRRIHKFCAHLLYPHESFPNVWATLCYLRNAGFQPRAVIDVGAYRGDWARSFKGVFPQAKVLMLEAQESKRPVLDRVSRQCDGLCYQIVLLGAADGETVQFVEMETGSSVFEEQSPYQREVIEKEQRSLDTLLKNHDEFKQADLLKLDVQGYEIEVLKGASDLLRHTQCVYLEASLIPTNQGCPSYFEVYDYLNELGFRLLDICHMSRRRDGSLWQTDLMFVRNDSVLVPDPQLTRENWD